MRLPPEKEGVRRSFSDEWNLLNNIETPAEPLTPAQIGLNDRGSAGFERSTGGTE
jgi:hypothetical protein